MKKIYLPQTSRELSISEKVISFRHVKEALEVAFTVNFEDTYTYILRGKIVRFARIFGGPIIWPSAIIEVKIDNEREKLFYTIYWPDYYMVLFTAFAVLIGYINGKIPQDALTIFIGAPLFVWLAIYLDTRYVLNRINRYLSEEVKAT